MGVHRQDRRAWAARSRPSRPGYQQDEIEQAAYEYAKSIDDGEKVIVGVNQFTSRTSPSREVFPIDPELQRAAGRAGRSELRADRDQAAVDAALADVAAAARGTQNLLPPMKEALRRRATLGEVSDALRDGSGCTSPPLTRSTDVRRRRVASGAWPSSS